MEQNKTNHAVIYCRTATDTEKSRGDCLKAQEKACRIYAHQMGYRITDTFVDNGATGNSLERPGLQQLLSFLEDHTGYAVIIQDISCLSRSTTQFVKLRSAISDAGCRLESPNMTFDESPESQLMESLMVSRAEYEDGLEASSRPDSDREFDYGDR